MGGHPVTLEPLLNSSDSIVDFFYYRIRGEMSGNKASGAHEYHGVLEVTDDHIRLSPRVSNLELRRRILWDFISQEANGHPWHTVGLPHHPEPRYMLSAITPSVLDRLKGNADHQAPASSASPDHPFDGALYALGITPIPDSPYHFRLCDTQLLAVRKGEVWQDLSSSPVTDKERKQAARTALETIRADHLKTLEKAGRKR